MYAYPLVTGIIVAVAVLLIAVIVWLALNIRVRKIIDNDPRFQVALAVSLSTGNFAHDRSVKAEQRRSVSYARERAELIGPGRAAARVRDITTACVMVAAVIAGALTTITLATQ